jgi:hypothetical protein
MMKIPASMVKPIPSGHPLVYNMCAICIAYAYITRHLGVSPLNSLSADDPERHEIRRLVAKLVPFLTDRKMTSDLFSLLLRDTAHLLEPLRVTQVEFVPKTSEEAIVPDSHPHIKPILVLSDLKGLFLATKSNHINHKLFFYAAHIASTPSAILQVLVEEMRARAEIYRAEADDKIGIVEMKRVGAGEHWKLVEDM